MRITPTLLALFVAVSGVALRANAATIYAQTGFNDQSGINSDPTPNSPYTIGSSINGLSTSEVGWSGPWTVLNGGARDGDSNVTVSSANPYEGDGAAAFLVGSFGSTELYRDLATTRSDHFVVQTAVNFGSVGDFEGTLIQDNYPFSSNVNGVVWRLTGAVGSRHFEVFNGDHANGGTWINTGIAQTPGSWQDVSVDVNVPAQNWTFSVDGTGFNQTLGFQGTPPQLNSVYFFSTAAGSVDSVIVQSTPEPGAPIGLAIVAGTLSLRRRRRPC